MEPLAPILLLTELDLPSSFLPCSSSQFPVTTNVMLSITTWRDQLITRGSKWLAGQTQKNKRMVLRSQRGSHPTNEPHQRYMAYNPIQKRNNSYKGIKVKPCISVWHHTRESHSHLDWRLMKVLFIFLGRAFFKLSSP